MGDQDISNAIDFINPDIALVPVYKDYRTGLLATADSTIGKFTEHYSESNIYTFTGTLGTTPGGGILSTIAFAGNYGLNGITNSNTTQHNFMINPTGIGANPAIQCVNPGVYHLQFQFQQTSGNPNAIASGTPISIERILSDGSSDFLTVTYAVDAGHIPVRYSVGEVVRMHAGNAFQISAGLTGTAEPYIITLTITKLYDLIY
jgi:hypothetical protein